MNINEILKTKTFTQSFLTICATILNGILGVVFFIFLARSLGPQSLGILAFTIAFITLVADIANLGTDSGIIRFIGKYSSLVGEDKRILKLALEVKLLAWVIIFIIGWISIPSLVKYLFLKPELLFPLRLSLLGIGGALLYSFIMSSIQAYQKFWYFSIIMVGTNAIRLIFVVLLIIFSVLSLENALIIYITAPFLGFFLGLLILPSFFTVKNEWNLAKDFFHYNKWIALIIIVGAVGSRLDTFLLTKFHSIAEVGIYSVAVQLTSFIPQIFFALASVAAPKLAGFNEKKKAADYFKKLQALTFGLSLLGLLGIPLGFIFIPVFYGSVYSSSVAPFVVLLLGQLLFLLSLPSHQMIYYYFAKPKIILLSSILEILVIATSGLVLIPTLGILGASISIFLGGMVILFIPAIWVSYKLFYK